MPINFLVFDFPFILENLNVDFFDFNKKLSDFYKGLVIGFLAENRDDLSIEQFGIETLSAMKTQNQKDFILELVKYSFDNIPNSFISSMNKKGTRYDEIERIKLDQIF